MALAFLVVHGKVGTVPEEYDVMSYYEGLNYDEVKKQWDSTGRGNAAPYFLKGVNEDKLFRFEIRRRRIPSHYRPSIC